MHRTEQLRKQAKVLRSMAADFEILSIRDRLLSLASMTDQLAAVIDKANRVRQSAPIDLALKKPPPDHR